MSYQLSLSEVSEASEPRRVWVPPAGREILRLSEYVPEIRPIVDPGDTPEKRRDGRRVVLDFLREFHYLHKVEGAKDPVMTWAFGLYLRHELAGVVVLNPPAAGVCQWLYGDNTTWRRQVIAATRVCCSDPAPYSSESFFVSGVWRMLPRLDHRFTVGVAMSDLAVVDPYGRHHSGGIYAASNGWWAGVSDQGGWRGFVNPETGARISRKCGGRNLKRNEVPAGWEIDGGARLNRFLWFVGRNDREAKAALREEVEIAIKPGRTPVWRRPLFVRRGTRRAYLASFQG